MIYKLTKIKYFIIFTKKKAKHLMSEQPILFPNYDKISSIMEIRSEHLAKIEEIENEFNEKLESEVQKLFELFQRANEVSILFIPRYLFD